MMKPSVAHKRTQDLHLILPHPVMLREVGTRKPGHKVQRKAQHRATRSSPLHQPKGKTRNKWHRTYDNCYIWKSSIASQPKYSRCFGTVQEIWLIWMNGSRCAVSTVKVQHLQHHPLRLSAWAFWTRVEKTSLFHTLPSHLRRHTNFNPGRHFSLRCFTGSITSNSALVLYSRFTTFFNIMSVSLSKDEIGHTLH